MNKICEIELSKLKSYREHIFPLYSGDRLDRLVESIKNLGVLNPIIVQSLDFKGNSYEILAGHNRVNACSIAGLTAIPAIVVVTQSDEEAKLIAIETNMCQRSLEEIPISTKSKAIAQWYECIKSQGSRTDLLDEIDKLERLENLENSANKYEIYFDENEAVNPDKTSVSSTSCQIGTGSEASEFISSKTGLSAREIHRLIRISKLSDELLEKIDNDIIPLSAAYELSFVPNDTLFTLNIFIDTYKPTLSISIKAAQNLRAATKGGKVITNSEELITIINGEKKIKKEKSSSVTIKPKVINKYFENVDNKKIISQRIEQSLELTEVIIPQILNEKNIKDAQYSKIIPAALNMYFDEKEKT